MTKDELEKEKLAAEIDAIRAETRKNQIDNIEYRRSLRTRTYKLTNIRNFWSKAAKGFFAISGALAIIYSARLASDFNKAVVAQRKFEHRQSEERERIRLLAQLMPFLTKKGREREIALLYIKTINEDLGARIAELDKDADQVYSRNLSGLCPALMASPESCLQAHNQQPKCPSGLYTINVKTSEGIRPTKIYCDMNYSGGGWALIYATRTGNFRPEPGIVRPGKAAYLPRSIARGLASKATQVHIRSANQPTRYITSKSQGPIQKLQLGRVLNWGYKPTGIQDSVLQDWTGPMAKSATLTFNPYSLAESSNRNFPNIYHAINNADGLHLQPGLSRWSYSHSDEAMEVYIR